MVQPDTGAREHRERRQGLLAAGPEGAVADDRAGQPEDSVAAEAGAAFPAFATPVVPGTYYLTVTAQGSVSGATTTATYPLVVP